MSRCSASLSVSLIQASMIRWFSEAPEFFICSISLTRTSKFLVPAPFLKREITYLHFRLHSGRKFRFARDGVCWVTSIDCRMSQAFSQSCVEFPCRGRFYRVPSSNRCTTWNGAAKYVQESRSCLFLGARAEKWNQYDLLLAWGFWCKRSKSQRWLEQSE